MQARIRVRVDGSASRWALFPGRKAILRRRRSAFCTISSFMPVEE